MIRRLALRARKRSPEIFKVAYRMSRAARSREPSVQIPQHLLDGCKFYESRTAMLAHFPKSGIVAELGTFKGHFAYEILGYNHPAELHVVDLDFSQLMNEVRTDARIVMHEGHTVETISSFPDEHFDWIYVDADHSYEGALADAVAAAPKVRKGGFLAFNDFAHNDLSLGQYGVHRAVTAFATDRQWPFVCFAYHPHGLYDVALQRPS
jgi:predicted O-methyltransferase YrrM